MSRAENNTRNSSAVGILRVQVLFAVHAGTAGVNRRGRDSGYGMNPRGHAMFSPIPGRLHHHSRGHAAWNRVHASCTQLIEPGRAHNLVPLPIDR